jgi:uncharacterized membrane protein HdeD (DUF308 family)
MERKEDGMVATLARYWWVLLIRGLAALLFGIAALVWPEITVEVLVLLAGAYLLVDGVFSAVAAFGERTRNERWWVALLEGLVGVVAGLLIFVWPGLTALLMLYMIAAWAILTGILEIVAAIRLRQEIEGEFFLILGGIASLVFGILAILFPGGGAVAVVWMIAIYAIVFGVLLTLLAFRVRGMA